MWNNLRFFNGVDEELQLVQNEDGVWTGKVYMPEVSTYLYETVNLFILEECTLLGDTVINKPISPDGVITTLDFSWQPMEADVSLLFHY